MTSAMMHIRDALPQDAPALSELKLTTFRQTFLQDFAIPYPPVDLALFEVETYGVQRVATELADQAHRSWVVEGDGKLIAYAHVGPCKLPHPEVKAGDMELYQLYLRRSAQGLGLGKRLLDHALGFLDGLGEAVWLGVWSGNDRAQALYRTRGFVAVGKYKFCVGEWRDDELILRRSVPAA